MARTLLLALVLASTVSALQPGFLHTWSYIDSQTKTQPYGPSQWNIVFPACGNGSKTERQSPISITPAMITVNTDILTPLVFQYTASSAEVENIGSTVDVTPVHRVNQTMRGGLGGNYILSAVHFHWNNKAPNGSEHAIANYRVAAEAHFVHYSSKYANLADAVHALATNPGSVAVVAALYSVSPAMNTELEKVRAVVQNIDNPEESNIIANWNPRGLFPNDPELRYYQYNGSLTTPSCNEGVYWYVFQRIATISQPQLDALRTIKHLFGNETYVISHNVRPLQPANGRKVWAYPDYEDTATFVQKLGSAGVAGALLGFGVLGTIVVVIVFIVVIVRAH
jgi:carbonic anhydrase